MPAPAISSRVGGGGARADVEAHPAVGHVDAVELADARRRRRTRSPSTRSIGSSSAACRRASAAARGAAGSTPSSSHSEAPTSWPWALKNGKHIAPPIRIASARSQERVEHADLVGHLRAADDRDERARRGLRGCRCSVSTSRCSSRPGGAAASSCGDARGRGVRAVRGAERVVDVDVGERRVAPRELGVVLRLPRLEADVLEHHDRRRRGDAALERLGADDGASARRRRAARARRVGDRAPARAPGRAPFGRPEVRGEHEPRAARRAAPRASAAPRGCACRR